MAADMDRVLESVLDVGQPLSSLTMWGIHPESRRCVDVLIIIVGVVRRMCSWDSVRFVALPWWPFCVSFFRYRGQGLMCT
jgi:hypothetical protein